MGKLFSGYPIDFYNLNIVVSVDKNANSTYNFLKKFVDITPKAVSVSSFNEVGRWYKDPMMYYFQQYKFALYCATALCGVSKDQLTRGLLLTKSLMNFHVMYQTKKILTQLEARNPGDRDFDPYNNPYNKTEYRKILNEFNAREKDIPKIDQPADGLGFAWRSATGGKIEDSNPPSPALTFESTGAKNIYRNIKPRGTVEPRTGGCVWGGFYNFDNNDDTGIVITKVVQDKFNYRRIVPDHSRGFTSAGLVRINDSIRAYVYCLLGAQVQARQAGTSLESQQQFLVLVNDLIVKQQTLQESVVNFQDALSKTRGKVNYVIAKGLYILPSDMNLNELGQSVKGFNDQIQIAKQFDKVGVKPDPPPPKPVIKLPAPKPVVKETLPTVKPTPGPVLVPKPTLSLKAENKNTPSVDIHEGSKLVIGTSIVIGGIAYSMFT